MCMVCMALITAITLCTRSQDSSLPVLLPTVYAVSYIAPGVRISTTGFKGGGKLRPRTRRIEYHLKRK